MSVKKLLIILLFLLPWTSGFAKEPILIDHPSFSMMAGKNLELLEDPSGNRKASQVIGSTGFKALDRTVPNLGFTHGAFWVRFSVENRLTDTSFILQINQSLLDRVTLYTFSEDGRLLDSFTNGEQVSIENRKYKDQYFMFDLKIPKGEHRKFLMRISSGEQILLPVMISGQISAQERNRNRDILFGVYFGIILVMMAYNLFLYFTVNDKSYLLYVIYIFFVGFTQGVLEGYGFKYLWSGNFWLASRSVYFSTSLVCVTSISFMKFFLHTREYAPKVHRLSYLIYFVFVICVIGNAIKVNQFTHNLTQVAVGFVSFYILTTSVIVYRKGYRTAKFFLVAWIVLIIGIFIFVMKDAGIIEANIFTTYTMQIGSALEVVILSLALADRINILKKEKEESQAEALQRLQENERLITEQNVMLEQKVRERTDELEVKNDELGRTLQNLKETQSQLVAVEKMASLGQLTAGIAHEINNPINFVSANIKPLQMDIADVLETLNKYEQIQPGDPELDTKLKAVEKFKEDIELNYVKGEINSLLNGIEDGAKRTSEIVKGLKNFSHLDESDIKVVDINTGIKSTLVLLRSFIPANIEVVLELGEIPAIECYPGKLNQVFMNIMNNAVHAMTKNTSREKHILRIASAEEGEMVTVSFHDTGTGMTEEVRQKIFDPFFTTKDVGEGTGLGMSIAFGIMESHNGKIEIDSTPGEGTLVKLILPKQLKK